MKNLPSNPCTRCGKERIVSRTYNEEIATFFGTSTVTHTETVCPDPECQKIVEERLDAQKQKSQELKDEKQKKLDSAKAIKVAAAVEKAKEAIKNPKTKK
jgi:hypothetical protein